MFLGEGVGCTFLSLSQSLQLEDSQQVLAELLQMNWIEASKEIPLQVTRP